MRWLFPLTVLLMVSACTPPTQTTTDNAMVSEMSADEGDMMATDNMTATDGAMMSNDAMMSEANAMDAMASNDAIMAESSPYCAAVSAFVSAVECRRMEIQKEHLSAGFAAFLPPTKMVVGRSIDMTLALGDNQQTSKITDALGGKNVNQVKVKVQVGRYMNARLYGSAFTVIPLDSEFKDLGAGRFGTWQWRVTPNEEGQRALLLTVHANAIGSDGAPTMLELASKQFTIQVEVDKNQKIKQKLESARSVMDDSTTTLYSARNLLIAFGCLIAAVGAVFVAIRNFRKPSSGSSKNSDREPNLPPVDSP